MLDYHLHLWPHSQREAEATTAQVADYCERATAAGVTEIAVTEHLFRFVEARDLLWGFWEDDPCSHLHGGMASYWEHHAHADLDAYVATVEAVRGEGLPVVCGLEVDYYEGRMHEVAELLDGYPLDVLLGSVHWIGAWRFDVLDDPLTMAEWSAREVDAVWDAYTRAMEELADSRTCDVLAHPDL
ncbi:MAG TPA: PHP domain-containing protein, partial [Acidimicrobiales bacterium]|nr:PHP domain-containing protein [Acidimicrobiales bacterium]